MRSNKQRSYPGQYRVLPSSGSETLNDIGRDEEIFDQSGTADYFLFSVGFAIIPQGWVRKDVLDIMSLLAYIAQSLVVFPFLISLMNLLPPISINNA